MVSMNAKVKCQTCVDIWCLHKKFGLQIDVSHHITEAIRKYFVFFDFFFCSIFIFKVKNLQIHKTMLDGWYCRSMASQNSTQNNDHDDDNEPNVVDESEDSQDVPVARLMPRADYKAQYISLKKKLKFLLYVSSNNFDFVCHS